MMMKLCKDCAHARKTVVSGRGRLKATWKDAKCAHPNMLSPVDGSVVASCDWLRGYDGCGGEKLLFEQREGPDPVKTFNENQIKKHKQCLESEKSYKDLVSEMQAAGNTKGFFAWLFRL